MKREDISDAIGNISTKHIQEAGDYAVNKKKMGSFKRPFGRAIIAAVLALCLLAGGFGRFLQNESLTIAAYAYGTNEKIPSAGAVLHTGTISDSGEMTGYPMMFYLSGKDIVTVRFSCKNQQIDFVDWTEKRDEYGLAQNFTVSYGEDTSEYYYLLIDWVPNDTIRALTDDANVTIATLKEEQREDIIVMEITFANGKTTTKAITVSLLDDGTFFASFDDYKITEQDTFINRPDSDVIPRDILYSQDDSQAWSEEYPFGDAPIIEGDYQDADPEAPETVVTDNDITFTGTIIDNTIDSSTPVILVRVDEGSTISYDTVLFHLSDSDKEWAERIGTKVQITCSDAFQESHPPIGDLTSIKEIGEDDTGKNGMLTESNEQEAAEAAARAYYSNTVFEVVEMQCVTQSEKEVVFSVQVSKDNAIQDPNRSIVLHLVDGIWSVVNEGY